MSMKGNILIVDDDPLILKSLAELLRLEGYSVATSSNGLEALHRLKEFETDLILSDINMPDLDGIGLLSKVHEQYPEMPVIMITGFGTIENAVEAIKNGAAHYITKPLQDAEIKIIIARTFEQKKLSEERNELKQENVNLKRRLRGQFAYDNIIGRDAKMKKIFEIVDAVANTRATVLISGESGTGKTLIARAIHYNSNRLEKPFVEVNCGALPETLLESELFGHTKGSFTGAYKDKIGKFQLANGGTIFLDEIGNASPAFQVKLLRVLQDREFERIGQHETVKVDVRVVLATNMDLAEAVEKGDFREDLFYRINVVSMELPPLRHRITDLDLLTDHFLKKYTSENSKSISNFSEEALEKMRTYRWPGNIRELENVVERAVVLTKNQEIQEDDLPPSLFEEEDPIYQTSDEILPLKDALAKPEKHIIEKALKSNKWNRQKTAAVLKVNRTTLFNKMKKYGLLTD